MKRSVLFWVSPITSGLAVALVLQLVLQHFPGAGSAMVSKIAAVAPHGKSAPLRVETMHPAPIVAAPLPAPTSDDRIAVVLLAEPMVIIRGNEFSGVELRRGTRLDVIKDNGDYLEVRYGGKLITIPRSSIIKGVFGQPNHTVQI